jgi:hypothetical protein
MKIQQKLSLSYSALFVMLFHSLIIFRVERNLLDESMKEKKEKIEFKHIRAAAKPI